MAVQRLNFLAFFATLAVAAGQASATELYDAVKNRSLDRVVELLDSGADPNKPSPYNGPLHEAARLGLFEITTKLIQAGADIELAGFGGVRPLHSAAMAGHSSIVSVLLKGGAKADSLDNTGRSPLLSVLSGDVDDTRTLIALLEAGANPNSLDGPARHHPLDYAALHGRADAVEILIAFGADMNAKDNLYGQTPLHYAIASCTFPGRHIEVVELLIELGADVNVKDAQGLTPLEYAKRHVPNAGYLHSLLSKAGAK